MTVPRERARSNPSARETSGRRPALAYLDSLGMFSDRFLRHLESLRFTGDVHALPEGTPVFGNEPLLEIEAPIAEAQFVETFGIQHTPVAAFHPRLHLPDGAILVNKGDQADRDTYSAFDGHTTAGAPLVPSP